MSTTVRQVTTVPPLRHREAMRFAATEYDRFVAALDRVQPGDWARPTDNELWDVKAMVAHVLGAMESNASAREAVRQQRAAARAAKATGMNPVDATSDLQVKKHGALSSSELAARVRATAPKALRGRRRTPALVRAIPFTPGPPFPGRWPLGYLIDTIYTRDTWMHRVDLCRATGQEMALTPDHDGRIVGDVVGEWARAHGQPFLLALTGSAGGTYAQGDGGERHELDAVEFCRILSGRATGSGLLTQEVPF